VEQVSSIFRVAEKAKQETSVKQVASNRLHGVMTQKIELFITTVVRTSNLTSPYKFPFSFENQSNNTILGEIGKQLQAEIHVYRNKRMNSDVQQHEITMTPY
jgi:hypothetical protein